MPVCPALLHFHDIMLVSGGLVDFLTNVGRTDWRDTESSKGAATPTATSSSSGATAPTATVPTTPASTLASTAPQLPPASDEAHALYEWLRQNPRLALELLPTTGMYGQAAAFSVRRAPSP